MKILIVRFSSIGDIVLTTPIVAALKSQMKNAEIHYLTKKSFRTILEHNPNIDKLICIEKNTNEVINELQKENYDFIVDLHKNIRTLKLKRKLGRPAYSFPKLNIQKWFLVNFKIKRMPKMHIVDRYFEAVKKLGVKSEHKPCEYYLGAEDQVDTQKSLSLAPKTYVGIAIGAQFATKQVPTQKWVEILKGVTEPVVILGGPMDAIAAEEIIKQLPGSSIQSACGKFSLNQSASIVAQAKVLVSNDTGLMHIATCFNTKVVSIWGSTVPELGMYPYYPTNKELYSIHEVKNLSCRPCSKIGYQKCPKGHFNCMNQQDAEAIRATINA